MKKLQTALLIAILGFGVVFIGTSAANANTTQVVPTTQRVSRKVYRKSRRGTVTTYKYGKRYTKKGYRTGNRWGHKAGRKTKHFVMGPPRRTP